MNVQRNKKLHAFSERLQKTNGFDTNNWALFPGALILPFVREKSEVFNDQGLIGFGITCCCMRQRRPCLYKQTKSGMVSHFLFQEHEQSQIIGDLLYPLTPSYHVLPYQSPFFSVHSREFSQKSVHRLC
jgi:hypothetical protein